MPSTRSSGPTTRPGSPSGWSCCRSTSSACRSSPASASPWAWRPSSSTSTCAGRPCSGRRRRPRRPGPGACAPSTPPPPAPGRRHERGHAGPAAPASDGRGDPGLRGQHARPGPLGLPRPAVVLWLRRLRPLQPAPHPRRRRLPGRHRHRPAGRPVVAGRPGGRPDRVRRGQRPAHALARHRPAARRPRQRRAVAGPAHPGRRARHRRAHPWEDAMKVLLAGASGAIGIPLTRQLLAHDHQVLGLTRDQAGARRLRALGATPVVADALDGDGLLRAVHGLSALREPPLRHRGMALTDRLRSQGTTNLLAAAEALGARRFLTQSFILGYGYRDHGPRPLTEDDPFGLPAGDRCDPHVAAMRSTEEQAFSAPEGIALRYGLLYGGDGGRMRDLLARRGVPVASGGVLGWVHHTDAAAATVAALERGRPGQAYNVVDDLPASWWEVYTAMAKALGAPPPWRLPDWLLRLAAPYVASFVVGTSMRVSNAKATAELGWRPLYPNYRVGVHAMAAVTKEEPCRSPGRSGAGTRSA